MGTSYCIEKEARNARVARAPSPAALDFELVFDLELAFDFGFAFDLVFVFDREFALSPKSKAAGEGARPT
jgi:hypothetical protein